MVQRTKIVAMHNKLIYMVPIDQSDGLHISRF